MHNDELRIMRNYKMRYMRIIKWEIIRKLIKKNHMLLTNIDVGVVVVGGRLNI